MGFIDRIFRVIKTPKRVSVHKMAGHLHRFSKQAVRRINRTLNVTPTVTSTRKQKVDFNSLLHDKTAEAEALAIQKQSAKGKLSARQRIDLLVDENSFVEIGQFVGNNFNNEHFTPSAVITGFGNIDGRKVCVYAQDFSVHGGSLGEVEGQKICHIIDIALEKRVPIIALLDSGGARIEEGVGALGYYGKIFNKTVRASGIIPQFSLILGPCAGGAVYCPALTDFVIMTRKNSHMFVTGPDVVRAVTGEDVSADDLGGGLMHSETSGVCHYLADDEEGALEYTRVLLSFLPSNFADKPPLYESTSSHSEQNANYLEKVVPSNPKQSYDVLDVIYALVDYEEFIEVHQLFAPSAVVGFGRFNGETCGIVANQPHFNAGTLDIDASEKIARFVRFCNAYSIPIVTLVDVPGYRPGVQQERAGIIRRGAKVITAYASTTVPLITIILRKAYGGAYIVMGSKEIGADINLCWPSAEIAVLGAEGAVQIIHKKRLEKAQNDGENVDQLKKQLVEEYSTQIINANLSQQRGSVDTMIAPQDSRRYILRSLDILRNKQPTIIPKKQDNQPL